ncbi:Hypothetical protein CINCED_3A004528 [Cinara cedri]|uniref:Transport and Golgi organization protein 1 n=1 Tax=Cinara cedri TaxID=506608 RepID=A0A5E4M1A5_9HEMI|nr:Hypothetical protein CINCED_3A004528 [Cinara cedri]
MFLLKTIVILLTVLHIIAAQCNTDQFIEFNCKDSSCKDGDTTGKMKTNLGKLIDVTIIGYSVDKFLVKYKDSFSIIKHSEIHRSDFSKMKFKEYNFKVNIHNTTYKTCESSNQNNDSPNDSNIAQISKNVDTHHMNNISQNAKFSKDEITKNQNQNSETDSIHGFVKKDNSDESIPIKNSEDEPEDNTTKTSLSTKNLNADDDFSKETNQMNIAKSTNSQKFENDSSTKCPLGSCDTHAAENIIPVNEDNLHQKQNNHKSSAQYDEKIESLKKESVINVQQQNTKINGLPDSDYNIDESNISISNERKNIENSGSIETSQNDENADTSKEPGNNEQQQNYKTDGLPDIDNNTDESNISIPKEQKNVQNPGSIKTSLNDENLDTSKKPGNNGQLQNYKIDGLPDSDNNTDELNILISNKQKIVQNLESIETSQSGEKVNTTKEPGNNEQQQNYKTDGLPDIDNNTDESNISIPKEQKIVQNLESIKTSQNDENADTSKKPESIETSQNGVQVNTTKEPGNNEQQQNYKTDGLPDIDNNTDESNISISNERKNVELNTPMDEKTESPKGFMNNVHPQNSKINSSPQDITEVDNENLGKTKDSPIKKKLKQVESISIVASFGHPDTCSGVNCLKNKKNAFKPVHILNPIPKQVNLEDTSHLTITDFEKQKKYDISDKITTEKSSVESFSDHIINGLFSPTSNSFNFLWNMFGDYSNEYNDKYPDQSQENQKMFEYKEQTNNSELYFVIADLVTILIVVFLIFHYKYQKGTHANDLLTSLAAKDQYLLIIEKELSLLKEQRVGINTKSIETISEIESLNEQLAKSEDIISTQEFRIQKLEQEVEELTESGMEMHALLSSALESSSKNNEKYSALKEKLVDSQNLVTALTKKNFNKTTELEKKNDIIKTLQTTVDELTNKNICLVEDNTKISFQKDQIVSKNQLRESKLLDEINNLQFELNKQTDALVTAENEVLLSKDALEEMFSQKFNANDVKKNMSLVKLSAEIKSAKQIGESYKKKLDESLKSNQEYLDQIDDLKSNIVNLEEKCSQLKISNEESLSKLNILTQFFKEQEKEYIKQINDKAMVCDDKDEESSNLHERLKSLNQEITNYKSEIQSLKKEIIDQEASFKIQISAETKKANDHWISFRQAERKLKEMELETAQLRNKLTMVDKKLENDTRSIDSSKDFEDELLDIPLPIVSPDFTLLDFEPPPPIFSPTFLQHVSADQRLPPLGALGQASSPPIPSSRRHNRSLSPGSPSPQQRSSLFRPLPLRHNYINRQNSLGHSTESLDK